MAENKKSPETIVTPHGDVVDLDDGTTGSSSSSVAPRRGNYLLFFQNPQGELELINSCRQPLDANRFPPGTIVNGKALDDLNHPVSSSQDPLSRGVPINQTNNSEIQVLLVDHDEISLAYTANLLQIWSYQVTKVRYVDEALKMFSSGKKHFDLMIADVDYPTEHDTDGFLFCQEANKMGILVILTSAKEEPQLVKKAMENGAFLYMQKPLDHQMVKYLWQFVVGDRIRKNKTPVDVGVGGSASGGEVAAAAITIESDHDRDRGRDRGVKRSRRNTPRIKRKIIQPIAVESSPSPPSSDSEETPPLLPPPDDHDLGDSSENCNKQKMCTEWTKELHEKFMNAVYQLGEGRCYPKEILELMKVPGLTRMQVASHLQKCRHNNWRPSNERRNRGRLGSGSGGGGERNQGIERPKMFGVMPHPLQPGQNQQNNPPLRDLLPRTNSVLSFGTTANGAALFNTLATNLEKNIGGSDKAEESTQILALAAVENNGNSANLTPPYGFSGSNYTFDSTNAHEFENRAFRAQQTLDLDGRVTNFLMWETEVLRRFYGELPVPFSSPFPAAPTTFNNLVFNQYSAATDAPAPPRNSAATATEGEWDVNQIFDLATGIPDLPLQSAGTGSYENGQIQAIPEESANGMNFGMGGGSGEL